MELNDLENPRPEPAFNPDAPPTRKRRILPLLAVVAVVGVGLAVGLTLGLRKPHDPNQGSQQEQASNAGDEGGGNDGGGNEEDQNYEPQESTPEGKSGETTSESPPQYIPTDPKQLFTPQLNPFNSEILQGYFSCQKLLLDVEEAAKYLANLIIVQNKNQDDSEVIIMEDTPISVTGGQADKSASAESSFGTNNQVEDVDEGDIVKSDGSNVFLAYGNELVWMTINGTINQRFEIPEVQVQFPKVNHWEHSWGEEESVPSEKFFGGWIGFSSQKIESLLLGQDQLIVLVSHYSDHPFWFIEPYMTVAHVYSIQDTLVLQDRKVFKGSYQTARSVQGTMHVVTLTGMNSYAFSDALARYRYPDVTDDQYATAAYNKAVTLLPQYSQQLLAELIGSQEDGSLDEETCSNIMGLSNMVDLDQDGKNDPTNGNGILNGFAQVVSFDLDSFSPKVSGTFLPTFSLEAYANQDHMFLAGRGYVRDENWTYKDYTYLMGFSLSNGSTTPTSVGRVPGYFLNQFSMDYYEDHLRVATTIRAKWGYNDTSGNWEQMTPSSSQLTIMEQSSNFLQETGKLTDLGTGEDIYSVRFVEDKAFLVTFERIDPFFTFDLSDPNNPVQVGELKISGYSNYLHPIDEYHVLAVGQDVNATNGQTIGFQIAIFDTTDFANPTQLHKFVIKGWSSSGAQDDHKAFRYLPQSEKLILPVSVYSNSDDNFDGFHVYKTSVEEGISKVGDVTHANARLMMRGCFSDSYVPPRSMVFSGELMTMKGHSVIMSNSLDDPVEKWSFNLDENKTKSEYDCYPWF